MPTTEVPSGIGVVFKDTDAYPGPYLITSNNIQLSTANLRMAQDLVFDVDLGEPTEDEAVVLWAIGGSISINSPTISSITNGAFMDTGITYFNAPNCTSIGQSAFRNCYNLSYISMPLCRSIGNYAFYCCSSLNSVSFPEFSMSIRDYTFAYCSNLTTVYLPKMSQYIGYAAFRDCCSLTSVEIPQASMISD